jgi:protein gp37
MMDISRGKYWDKLWSLVDMSVTNYTDVDGHFDGRITVHPERLSIPTKRRKPTVYAVWNDLFHEDVPDEFIGETLNEIWEMGLFGDPRHTFLILTKRAERMERFLNGTECAADWNGHKVYFGLTICNQQEADEKIPVFLQVPGKKLLSIEPCLGNIDLETVLWTCGICGYRCDKETHELTRSLKIDAVILGGETGPGARPIHPDWVRSVRDQCAAAGVPFFFKGWGKQLPGFQDLFGLGAQIFQKEKGRRLLDGKTYDSLPWKDL